jgi:hypothetical protein
MCSTRPALPQANMLCHSLAPARQNPCVPPIPAPQAMRCHYLYYLTQRLCIGCASGVHKSTKPASMAC